MGGRSTVEQPQSSKNRTRGLLGEVNGCHRHEGLQVNYLDGSWVGADTFDRDKCIAVIGRHDSGAAEVFRTLPQFR